MQFEMRRTKSMKEVLHWVHYFYCISGDPTIIDLNEVMFIHQLDTALHGAEIKRNLVDQSKKKAKESSTSPLKSEKK